METISIGTAEAIEIFVPALTNAPVTQIHLLLEGLKLEIERQFNGISELPENFFEAVIHNSKTIAKKLRVELIWVSLNDFETTIPIRPQVVSGPAIRLNLLDQILLDAVNNAFWRWWNAEEMKL